jgi:alcohol dehydrogenase YqhD (iron-dependent ADH family)
MLDFTCMISTKILFGKNKIAELADELQGYGKNVLFVYGQGSIQRTRLFDTIIDTFTTNSLRYYELAGVQPNPRITLVRKGIDLCRKHDVDCILAVGGGSVIDSAKTIAAGFYYDGDPWEMFVLGDSTIKKAVPVGTILTFAGTGSEMNGNAVISNNETQEKRAIHQDVLRPRFSILDPTYTFTVPRDQTAAGVVDIFSHILEQYFSPTTNTYVQDRLAESLLATCLYYGPIALTSPRNYQARAQLMWTSSLALNGLLGYGKLGDWATHGIEHAVSAMYDVTHGVGLAILTPYWMEYTVADDTVDKFVKYAQNVWNVKGNSKSAIARTGIKKTREFFTSLGMPMKLSEVGVREQSLDVMADKIVKHGAVGKFKKLDRHDVLTILRNAF